MSALTARLWWRAAARPAGNASLAPLRSATGIALIAATVLASGVGSYDAYVVNVAVPAIGRHFGASVTAIQWTLTSYLLSVAALLLIAGALADRFGRQALLLGLGLGLTVTPLTAAVLTAVGDTDLGEASAINDAASRVGGAVAVALVPVLIGASGGRGFAHALEHGFESAMLAIAGISAGGALVAALFVGDDRIAAPRFAPPAPDRGCALPVTGSSAT